MDRKTAEAAIRSALRSDLLYEPLRTVNPLLAVIADYAVPTDRRLVEITNDIAGKETSFYVVPAYVTPPRTADKDVTLTFPHSKGRSDLSHPKIDFECIPDDRPGVVDPVLPVYYSYDASVCRILATDRISRKAVEWYEFGESDNLLVESMACPTSGVLFVLLWYHPKRYLKRIADNNTFKLISIRNQHYVNSFGAMVATPESKIYAITTDGPFEIAIDGSNADLKPLVAYDGNVAYDRKILIMMSNGLLLAKVSTSMETQSLVVIDPSRSDCKQTILPFDDRSVRVDSVACSRNDDDLLYLTVGYKLFEFYLSSDVWSDVHYSSE